MKIAKSKYERYLGLNTCLFMIEFLVGLDMQEKENNGMKAKSTYTASSLSI